MRALSEPILDGGLRTTHFFNGRLLSAEDLALDQVGNREARQRLGRAVGSGIATGLETFPTPGTSTAASPTVTVRAGMALNRKGHVLCLTSDAELSLVRRLDAVSTDGAMFRECKPQHQLIPVTGDGLYVLVLAPASGTEGRAPVSGLGNTGAACNARYDVEGVQFRLVQVPVDPTLLTDTAHLRNRAAHACFGIAEALTAAFVDPFERELSTDDGAYGVVDGLRATQQITDCDVPLALLYWTARDGIQFVDNWSVRRRVTAPDASNRWTLFHGNRRASEAEAMFLQFQEQIGDMLDSEPGLTGFGIADRFELLPPLGIVPISVGGLRTGFAETLFDGYTLPHVAMLDGERLRGLIADSFNHEPVALTAGDRVQLYTLYENQLAVEQGITRRTLVFTSATLPFRGTARFAYGRWNLARYGTSR